MAPFYRLAGPTANPTTGGGVPDRDVRGLAEAPRSGDDHPVEVHMSRGAVLALLGVLIVLHHDAWFWADGTLVFGAIPVGLAWHVGYSVAASGVWWLVTRYAWPGDDGVSP